MDNKQMPDDKIAAEELLSDSELDSITGGGQLGTGCFGDSINVSNANLVPSSQINGSKHFAQLDMAHGKTGPG